MDVTGLRGDPRFGTWLSDLGRGGPRRSSLRQCVGEAGGPRAGPGPTRAAPPRRPPHRPGDACLGSGRGGAMGRRHVARARPALWPLGGGLALVARRRGLRRGTGRELVLCTALGHHPAGDACPGRRVAVRVARLERLARSLPPGGGATSAGPEPDHLRRWMAVREAVPWQEVTEGGADAPVTPSRDGAAEDIRGAPGAPGGGRPLPVTARAARAYLDVCFFHPFDDGQAPRSFGRRPGIWRRAVDIDAGESPPGAVTAPCSIEGRSVDD